MKEAFLSGNRIEFRAVEKEDLPEIRSWINSYTYRRFSRNEFPKTAAKQEAWYDNLAKSQDEVAFTVWTKEDCRLIGDCAIYNINFPDRKAEIGYGLGNPNDYRKGYGSEIVSLLCQYGFKELNLHRIYATIIEGNVGSQKILEKNGFFLEGRLREDSYVEGKYLNNLQYGILKKEWMAKKKA